MTKGSWSISNNVVEFILSNLKNDSTILEFGSGEGTGILSNNYNMMSIEQNKQYVDKYNSEYLYAPIVNGWYDVDKVLSFLENKTYDAILIDGPVGNNRIKMFSIIDKLNTGVLLIFDDIDREKDMENANKFSEAVGRKLNISKCGLFGYILPKFDK